MEHRESLAKLIRNDVPAAYTLHQYIDTRNQERQANQLVSVQFRLPLITDTMHTLPLLSASYSYGGGLVSNVSSRYLSTITQAWWRDVCRSQ